jgi:hypothetical protein
LNPKDRRIRTAESRSSLSYGLHIRLQLLSTPPRGDAVTFQLPGASISRKRTFTSQIAPAPRRTDAAPDALALLYQRANAVLSRQTAIETMLLDELRILAKAVPAGEHIETGHRSF